MPITVVQRRRAQVAVDTSGVGTQAVGTLTVADPMYVEFDPTISWEKNAPYTVFTYSTLSGAADAAEAASFMEIPTDNLTELATLGISQGEFAAGAGNSITVTFS